MNIDNQNPDIASPAETVENDPSGQLSEEERKHLMESYMAEEKAAAEKKAEENNIQYLEEAGANTLKQYRWALPATLFNGWRVERTIKALEKREEKIRQLRDEMDSRVAYFEQQISEVDSRLKEVTRTLHGLTSRKQAAETTLSMSQSSPEEKLAARRILATIDIDLQTAEANMKFATDFYTADKERIQQYKSHLQESYSYKLGGLAQQQYKSELHYTLLTDKRWDSKKLKDRALLRDLGRLYLLGEGKSLAAPQDEAVVQETEQDSSAIEPEETEPAQTVTPDAEPEVEEAEPDWAKMVEERPEITPYNEGSGSGQHIAMEHPVFDGGIVIDAGKVEAIRNAYKDQGKSSKDQARLQTRLLQQIAEELTAEHWANRTVSEERKKATASTLFRYMRHDLITQKSKKSANKTP